VWRGRRKPELSLLHEAGFQADGYAIHLAVNLGIANHQADGFGLRPTFECLLIPAPFFLANSCEPTNIPFRGGLSFVYAGSNEEHLSKVSTQPFVSGGGFFHLRRRLSHLWLGSR
jgi:hypothetical protein